MLHLSEYNKYIECKAYYSQLKNIMIGGKKPTVEITIDRLIIDFDKMKVIKMLGAGTFGTTYLVTYNGDKYAQKIQRILPEEKETRF